ncbi:MAG: hypothetical protein WCL06_13550 [Bacteroidota bacterium]
MNDTLHVDNNVSATILTTLLVFVTGIVINYVIKLVDNYLKNLSIRKSFRLILKEIVRQSKYKEKYIKQFYPTLTIDHKGNWPMKFFSMSHTDSALRQDFTTVFSAFNHFFRYKNWSMYITGLYYRLRFAFVRNKKIKPIKCIRPKKIKNIRLKAFNKTWSIIENLHFYENRLIQDFENLFKIFHEHENKYQNHMEDLRRLHDRIFQPLIGRPISAADWPPNVFNYIRESDTIWHEWEESDDRTHKVNTYNMLVMRLTELNSRYPDIEVTLVMNSILLAARYEYGMIENVLSLNRDLFYSYTRNYKRSWKVLEKCMDLLK